MLQKYCLISVYLKKNCLHFVISYNLFYFIALTIFCHDRWNNKKLFCGKKFNHSEEDIDWSSEALGGEEHFLHFCIGLYFLDLSLLSKVLVQRLVLISVLVPYGLDLCFSDVEVIQNMKTDEISQEWGTECPRKARNIIYTRHLISY